MIARMSGKVAAACLLALFVLAQGAHAGDDPPRNAVPFPSIQGRPIPINSRTGQSSKAGRDSPAKLDASALAYQARVVIPGQELIVGAVNKAADRRLDCEDSAVQQTIRRCALSGADLASAASLGRRVDNVTLNVHFQGEIVNMSVEFSVETGSDGVISQLEESFGRKPTIQYWADAAHLFASYIWVDRKTEVEITKTVKGAMGDGKVRMYVSSLLGGLPLNPADSR